MGGVHVPYRIMKWFVSPCHHCRGTLRTGVLSLFPAEQGKHCRGSYCTLLGLCKESSEMRTRVADTADTPKQTVHQSSPEVVLTAAPMLGRLIPRAGTTDAISVTAFYATAL